MKRNSFLQIFAGAVIIAGLVLSMFFFDENNIGSVISSIVTILATVIGALAFWFQLKKDTDMNQVEFIMELRKNFVEFDLVKIKNKLKQTDQEKDYSHNDLNQVSTFLIFFENLAPMVLDGTLPLKVIDNIFSYTFFLGVNHPVAQNIKIIPHADGFRGLIRLHKAWTDYRKKEGKLIVKEETSLECTMPDYAKYQQSLKKQKGRNK